LLGCPTSTLYRGCWSVESANSNGATHSFAAAITFTVFVWLVFRARGRIFSLKLVILVLSLYLSHVLLDYVTLDTGAPYGIPLFWPFSDATYQSPWLLLPNVQHTRAPIFSLHNGLLMIQEVIVFLPLLGLIRALKRSQPTWPEPRAWLYGGGFDLAVCASIFTVNER
jgi:membrane-bound metal-dependent hydrolase YbcI (DUF457 family)